MWSSVTVALTSVSNVMVSTAWRSAQTEIRRGHKLHQLIRIFVCWLFHCGSFLRQNCPFKSIASKSFSSFLSWSQGGPRDPSFNDWLELRCTIKSFWGFAAAATPAVHAFCTTLRQSVESTHHTPGPQERAKTFEEHAVPHGSPTSQRVAKRKSTFGQPPVCSYQAIPDGAPETA